MLESGLTGNLASPGQDRYGSLATPVPGTVMAAQVLVGSSDFHLANEAVHVMTTVMTFLMIDSSLTDS